MGQAATAEVQMEAAAEKKSQRGWLLGIFFIVLVYAFGNLHIQST